MNTVGHFIRKLFATKIYTPYHSNIDDVNSDIDAIRKEYAELGMKMIDFEYRYDQRHYQQLINSDFYKTITYTVVCARLYFVREN